MIKKSVKKGDNQYSVNKADLDRIEGEDMATYATDDSPLDQMKGYDKDD